MLYRQEDMWSTQYISNSKTSRVGQRLQLNWRDGDAKNPSGLEIIVDAKVALILSSDALVKVK